MIFTTLIRRAYGVPPSPFLRGKLSPQVTATREALVL